MSHFPRCPLGTHAISVLDPQTSSFGRLLIQTAAYNLGVYVLARLFPFVFISDGFAVIFPFLIESLCDILIVLKIMLLCSPAFAS